MNGTGTLKTVTIKRDNVGDYYLYLTCENPEPPQNLSLTGNEAGADFGMKTFLTLSDGIKIESPQFFKQMLTAIRSANKALSRKQKGSNAWYRAKRHLARLYKQIAQRRRDWFFKLALRLVRRYDKIAIETLNLEGMKRLWGRKVSDLAFGEFSLILRWMCAKYGKTLLRAGTLGSDNKTLLGLWGTHGKSFSFREAVDMPRLWFSPRPRHQRCAKHIAGWGTLDLNQIKPI